MISAEFGPRRTEKQLGNIPIIEVRRLTKRFPGVTALEQVYFSLFPGEIHALLGENGAGKTTLMNILYGLYRPDEGEVLVRGQPINHHSPQEAIQAGIGMVHQDFKLVPSLTVAENIILGDRTQPFWLSPGRINDQVKTFSEEYGLTINPAVRVVELSIGLQQKVAILKALYRGADVLILDEPTSVLTPQETKVLFDSLDRMKQQGKTIIFITHKLQEALTIADQITVLRKGRNVATVKPQEVDRNQLALMMVGREVSFDVQKPEVVPKEVVLSLENVFTGDNERRGLNGVSFQLRQGEILGIAGVAGNGQTELAEIITGLRGINRGTIRVNGFKFTKLSPLKAFQSGVTHIPEDRRGMGVAGELSVKENLVLRRFRQSPFNYNGLMNRKVIAEFSQMLVERFGIITPGINVPTKTLSGGNLQKAIVVREVEASREILVANLPTQGLDVAATAFVRRTLVEQQMKGLAVLLISQDLDEIMTLSDRIGVMFEGKMFGPFPRRETTREQVGLIMAGINPK